MPDPVTQQPPLDEYLERASESVGLGTAAKAIGVADHRNLLMSNARRVNDSHAAMMKAAGMEPSKEGDDEMGDITVTGDNHYHIEPKPVEPEKTKSPVPWIATALAIGIPAAILAWNATKPTIPSTPNKPPVVIAPGFNDTSATLRPDGR